MTFQCLKAKKTSVKETQARILAGDLDIKHIYHISKKEQSMKLIKILIPTSFCSDLFWGLQENINKTNPKFQRFWQQNSWVHRVSSKEGRGGGGTGTGRCRR